MWTAILTVGLQVLSWFLKKSEASDEIKKNFFEFIKLAGADIGSAKLMKYGDEQIEWLKNNPWKES